MPRRLLLIYLGLSRMCWLFSTSPYSAKTTSSRGTFATSNCPSCRSWPRSYIAENCLFWDPFTYCGNPIFANIQASFFHPLVLAGAFLSAHTSLDSLPMILEWVVALQICFAGMAAFHLFRRLGAGVPSAFAGAIIFETGGYFVSQTEHIGAVMAVAWMPLAWLSVLRLSEKSQRQMDRRTGSRARNGGAGRLSPGDYGRVRFDCDSIDRPGASPKSPIRGLSRWSSSAAPSVSDFRPFSSSLPPSSPTTAWPSIARTGWAPAAAYTGRALSRSSRPTTTTFSISRNSKVPATSPFFISMAAWPALPDALWAVPLDGPVYQNPGGDDVLRGFLDAGRQDSHLALLFPLLPVSVRIGIHPEYTFAISPCPSRSCSLGSRSPAGQRPAPLGGGAADRMDLFLVARDVR